MIRFILNYLFYRKHHYPSINEVKAYINKTPPYLFKSREVDVVNMYIKGHSLQHIGDMLNCTRERVRQILCKFRRKAKRCL